MSSERVVVLMKDFLGDAVMAAPLIDGLLASGRDVTLCTTEPIFNMLDAPTRKMGFVPLDRSKSLKASTQFARRLREGKFDVAIVVNRSFRSAAAARLARIRVRVGHSVERRGMLLTHAIPYDWVGNEAECYLDLGRALGIDMPSSEPKLIPNKEEIRAGKELLDGATVGIQTGATWDLKRLNLDVLAEVAKRLTDEGLKVALVGGSDELATAAQFLEIVSVPVVNLVGKTNLRGSMGILANLKFVIGGDTGLMHIAAAVGCGTVSVFGPKPSSKWGHFSLPHQVVESPGGIAGNSTFDMIWPAIERVLPTLKA